MRKLLYRFHEVVRLPDNSYGIALGNLIEDNIYADQKRCTVLVFNEFKTDSGDNGLRDLRPSDLRKQYEE